MVAFTCLTTRAIHIEVAHSISTDSFICALKRFIARRGKPRYIFSDNGTNFRGADRVLRSSLEEWNQNQIREFTLEKGIEWTFNPPGASHVGGAWERMIRSVRRILGALLKTQTPNNETFSTLITEVEGILNSRPLVPIVVDPLSEEPLTANHLLLLRGNCYLPPGLIDSRDCYAKQRWKQIQYLSNQFWKRWAKEFLPNLNLRQKWFREQANAKVGDIVLLVDDMQHRSKWLLGRIVDVYPDSKGRVRTVLVRTKNGTYKRPIAKLCNIGDLADSNSQSLDSKNLRSNI